MPVRSLLVPLVLVALAGPAVAAAACVPQCHVTATIAAFAPAAVLVESGGTVSWSTLDFTHTATAARSLCFSVSMSGRTVGSATFRIDDGTLLARNAGSTVEKTCTEASPLADGSFALQYVCLLHRNMVGEVVVRPGVDG